MKTLISRIYALNLTPKAIKKLNKTICVILSCVMLFNLTAEVFAAPFQLVSKEQQRGITSTLSDAYNNSSQSTGTSLSDYQNQYEKAFEEYANAQEKYEPLNRAIIDSEALMEFSYKSLSKETLKECDKLDQTDEQFDAQQNAFDKKVEALGGVEKLNEKYKQWEEYNKDYTEIEKAIEEQEQIIETNTSKLKQKDLGRDEITAAHSAIKTAKDNIKLIQKNYSKKFEAFEKLTKELTEIAQMDSDIELEGHRINGLHDVCETPIKAKELLLAGLADLPGAEELTGEMDLKDLMEKAKELSNVLEEEKEKAEQKYQQTEQALNEAIEKELNNRLEKYFIPANDKICKDKQEKVRKETGTALLGLKNGQRVPIEQDSVTGGSLGQTITAEVHASVGFNLRKEAELSCVNQPWTENLLKQYNAGITMEELSYIKYGEYMATYGLEDWDGKNITASEAKERGYELAKVVILYALGNLEAAVVDHNQLMGDYYQAKHLMNFLEQDWQNQDYGTIQKIKEDDWYEDEETGQMIEYQKKTLHFAPSAANKDLENSELIKSYLKRRIMFLNTKKILEQYFWELNDLLVDIMSYLAQEDVKPSDLPSILNNLGIPLSVDSAPEEYKQYVKDLIVRLNKESNVTDKEKVSQIAAEYAKERPEYSCAFEKRIDDMWTGWQNAKTTYDENERRIKIESYDWNHAESIKNLLAFNARMLPKYNYRYKKNLEAWNALGEKLRDEKAIDLLQYMLGLGHLISPGTDEKVMYKIQHYDGLYEESVKRDLEQLTGSMASTTTFGIVADVLENLIFVALGAKGSAQFSNSVRIGTRKMLRTGYKIALNSSMSRVMKKGYTPTSFRNIRRLSGKINNVTKEINDIKIRRDKVAKSGGKYHFSSSTGWVKEEALKGSFLHQFERKFANFTGLDVQPYRSTMFGSTKTSGSLASSFNPQKSEKPVMPRNNNKLSPEEIAQNKKAFQQNLAKVNTDLCGGHFRGAACVIVPMPQGALDVATGKASVTQVLNRNPYTSRLVNKTAKNTMKRMETEGLSVEQANKAFAEELNFRLEKSPFMPKARRQSIMRDVDSSLGLKPSNNANVERLSSAEKYGTSSSSMGHQPVKPGVNNPAHSAGLHGDVGRLDNIAQNMAGKSGKIPEGKVPTQTTNKPATTNKAVNTEEPTYTLGGNPPVKTTPSNVVTEDKGFFGNLKDRFNKFFKKEPTYELGGNTPKTQPSAKPQANKNNKSILEVVEVVEDTPATAAKTPAQTTTGKNNKSILEVVEVVEDTPATAAKSAQTKPVTREQKLLEYKGKEPKQLEYKGQEKPAAKPTQTKPVTPEQKQLGYKGQPSKSESPKDLVTTDGRFVSPDEVDLYLTDDISLPDFKGNFVRINEKTGKPLTRQDLVNENLTSGQKQLGYKGQEHKQLEYKGQEHKQLEYKGKETPAVKPVEKTPAQNAATASNKQPRNLLEGKTTNNTTQPAPKAVAPKATPKETRAEYLRSKGYGSYVEDFEEAGLLDNDFMFKKAQELVENKIHPKDILKSAEKGFSNSAALIKRHENLTYLQSKNMSPLAESSWQKVIDADYKAGTNTFERSKVFIEKGLDPMDVYYKRELLLSDKNFAKFKNMVGKDLSVEDFNKLLNADLFTQDGRSAMTEKLLQQGYKADDIVTLYKDMKYNDYHFSNNAENVLKGRKFLVNKNWTEKQAIALEEKGFGTEKGYERMKTILSKDGMTREKAYQLATSGWLDSEEFTQVSRLLDLKVDSKYFYRLRNEGYFNKYFTQTETLLKDGMSIEDVFKYKEAGLLDDFARTQQWMAKRYSFKDMETLRNMIKYGKVGEHVDWLINWGYKPSQITELYQAGKLNDLQKLKGLTRKGADFDALMKYLK